MAHPGEVGPDLLDQPLDARPFQAAWAIDQVQWLPESGEELRDFPLYFHYLNLLPDTPPGELLTDIYLPLK